MRRTNRINCLHFFSPSIFEHGFSLFFHQEKIPAAIEKDEAAQEVAGRIGTRKRERNNSILQLEAAKGIEPP